MLKRTPSHTVQIRTRYRTNLYLLIPLCLVCYLAGVGTSNGMLSAGWQAVQTGWINTRNAWVSHRALQRQAARAKQGGGA